MRKHVIILLIIVIASVAKQSYGQTDSTKQAKNYYAPWHQTINDTGKWNVSKFGHYFSVGMGYEHDYTLGGRLVPKILFSPVISSKIGGVALLSSYSIAYKSHLLTLTGGISSDGYYNSATPGYRTNYIGCLIGESIRLKSLLLSISVGFAYSNIYIYEPSHYKYLINSGVIYSNNTGISFPIEFKAFYLVCNGIGVGVHISENIVTTPKYSPFSACFSVVTGYWNKRKQ